MDMQRKQTKDEQVNNYEKANVKRNETKQRSTAMSEEAIGM